MTTSADIDDSPAGIQSPIVHKRASILGLPRELRDDIYRYALRKPQSTITMLSDYYAYHSEISAVQPALTCINRQVRHESLRVFYGENSFLAEVCSRLDLRKLSLCGWSCVQIGEASVRQWIRADLDLKDGGFKIRAPAEEGHPRLTERVGELTAAFRAMFESRSGVVYDVASVGRLMTGFHSLCVDATSYASVDKKYRFAEDDGSPS